MFSGVKPISFIFLVLNFQSFSECHYLIPQCVVSSLKSFIPTSDHNQLCNVQSEIFRRNWINSVFWAVNMKDASTGSINGLLAGDKFHPGHYDQCLNTKDATSGLRAQHCLITLQVDVGEVMRENPTEVIQKLHASISDPFKVRRDKFHVGVCIPNGCSHLDVEASFASHLQRNTLCAGLSINVTVPAYQCTTADRFQWNGPKFVFCSISIALGILVVFSTLLELLYLQSNERKSDDTHVQKRDLNYSKVERLSHSLVGFSMIRNARALAQEDLGCLAMVNVTKVIFLLIIVFGHRYLTLLYIDHPVYNMEEVENSYTNINYALLHSGSLVNDIFLSISGFLTAYSLLKSGRSRSGKECVTYVWRKVLKLYPAYLFTIGFTTILMADYSDGPFWNMKILPIVDECKRNWWTNVLFVNTFVNEADMCLISSWYTATSVQLMLGLTFAVYLAFKQPSLARYLFYGSLVFVVSTLFYIIYSKGQPPMIPFTIETLANPSHVAMYTQRYIKIYARATPYVIGVFAAILTIHLKRRKYQLSSIFAGSLFIASFGFGLGLCYVTFSLSLHKYTPFQNAVFGTLISILFSLAGTALYLSHVNSVGFGAFDSVIRSRIITVLSRLSLWVHVLNVPFQQMMAASKRTSSTFSATELIWASCGDIVFLYVFSLILYLTVEVPIIHLVEKVFSRNKTQKLKNANGITKNHSITMDKKDDMARKNA